MRLSYLKIFFGACFVYHSLCFADGLSSLTLTEAEMQKLKKFFPDESNHLLWQGDPLVIALPLGQEKRMVFSEKVSVDLKGSLTTDQLKLLNNDKSLYLTVLKSFPITRIFVTLKESGEVILIDLKVDDHATNSTQYIDVRHKTQITNTVINNSLVKDTTYVDLIRFSWQQTFAPERFIKQFPQYQRYPMHTRKFVSGLVYGDKVIAFPQASWLSGNRYATVVSLRNKYKHPTSIDIRKDLCGAWNAAVIYPRSQLQSNGDIQKDSTTLFLISKEPFGKVIQVCYGNA